METRFTSLAPGIYQFTYPTFSNTPQYICLHFLTPDQQAFVSYPQHRSRRAAQLIPISWFDSVEIVALEGEPRLMAFIEWLTKGLSARCLRLPPASLGPVEQDAYEFSQKLAA